MFWLPVKLQFLRYSLFWTVKIQQQQLLIFPLFSNLVIQKTTEGKMHVEQNIPGLEHFCLPQGAIAVIFKIIIHFSRQKKV